MTKYGARMTSHNSLPPPSESQRVLHNHNSYTNYEMKASELTEVKEYLMHMVIHKTDQRGSLLIYNVPGCYFQQLHYRVTSSLYKFSALYLL
jgi:hypothetical protein